MDKSTLGKIIRQQRRIQEITVKEMAEDVGVTRGYIHAIEKGEANPSLDVLNKILGKLEMKLTPETKVMID